MSRTVRIHRWRESDDVLRHICEGAGPIVKIDHSDATYVTFVQPASAASMVRVLNQYYFFNHTLKMRIV